MSADTTSDALPAYDEDYYATYEGTGYRRDGELMALAHHFADRVVATLAPATVLDAGCALGFVVEALRARGVEAWGVDVSEYAIGQVAPEVAEHCSVGSITEPFGRTVELIMCIEVIEHLPEDQADAAVANLCAHADRILLSSTPDDFEEPTHLNVRPPEYWSALFARHGFFRRLDFDASFISPWAVLYERRVPDLPEVVRDYDRSVHRLRDEVQRLRGALLEASRSTHGTDADAAAETEAEAAARVDALEARIAELEADNLGLRHDRLRMVDEVESATQRLGAALGRVTELESEVSRISALRTRYDDVVGSTTWRLMWVLLAPYRAARARLGRS